MSDDEIKSRLRALCLEALALSVALESGDINVRLLAREMGIERPMGRALLEEGVDHLAHVALSFSEDSE